MYIKVMFVDIYRLRRRAAKKNWRGNIKLNNLETEKLNPSDLNVTTDFFVLLNSYSQNTYATLFNFV